MEVLTTGNQQPQNIFKVVGPDRKEVDVHESRTQDAVLIDTDHNRLLSDDEIKSYLRKQHILEDPNFAKVDTEQIVSDYKTWLQDRPLAQDAAYHTYDQMVDSMRGLAEAHPDRAQLISLGKTHEGRDIWCLRVTGGAQEDTSWKPGVVYTGNHHAREWMSMEVPLHLAETLVNGYDTNPAIKARVDGAEIFIVPMVNPDGYEYSRTEDRWWRKNRTPITDTGCGNIAACNMPSASDEGQRVYGYGVDLNRNYWDGKPEHAHLYRPVGDLPCNTWDDFGPATSDDPRDDTYRGPRPASENEVRAMMELEYGRPNIKGVIDHHGYGEMLLRPWGHTSEDPANIAAYDELGARMRAAQSTPYRYMSGTDLYPTSGSSEDMHQANGILTFTIELGRSFQPPPSQFESIKSNVAGADFAFLDYILEKFPGQKP
ncbi:MAG: zinc carboxypeptidase, partial [Armatimonadetes bacterium]|nr:zinc carboxypeptidase [Armatimonadota bacterium]